MRSLPKIEQIWKSGGPYIGPKKPVTRVTVQLPWNDIADDIILRQANRLGVGSSGDRGLPMRWWQRQDNSQVERELPTVLSVNIDRSVDQDAASFTVEMANQWMHENGAAPNQTALGQPGYFTPTRGNSAEARARWGHVPNEWQDILVPNALLRIYTGFGGETGPIPTAVANGDLALYGVFLVDEVRITTSGTISLTGRDMAKLLIEGQLFPPLVPASRYPLTYSRWHYEDVPVRAAPKTVTTRTTVTTAGVTPGDKPVTYRESSQDRWYGPNASIHGHRGSESVDGNPHSYALSVGNSGPHRDFSTVWWEYNGGAGLNAVHVHPWAGGYDMFVSVMENGAWVPHPNPETGWGQDNGVVPYSAAHILATQSPAVDTGAAIPYVAKFHIPHEVSADYVLPRVYANAQRIRISFRNLYDSGIGPWKYRAGVREFRAKGVADVAGHGGTSKVVGKSVTYTPFLMAGASRIVKDKPYSQGYVTVTSLDQSDAFGDARRRGRTNYHGDPLPLVTGVACIPSGEGYYVLSSTGRIRTHGEAVHYGDPESEHGFDLLDDLCWDMAVTHTGLGYWVISVKGRVMAFGDAAGVGGMVGLTGDTLCSSIAAHPSAYGCWVLRTDGTVQNYGAATSYGGFGSPGSGVGKLYTVSSGSLNNANEGAQCIRASSTGRGYLILTSKGRVMACGDAKKHGEPKQLADHATSSFQQSYWELMPTANDGGYWLLNGSGQVTAFGDAEQRFGSPVPGTNATLRSDGEYTDYTDIARDLALWSGFLFYNPSHPANQPAPVYGALETTGAWAHERLPDEIFDKKPVIDALTTIREVVGYYCWIDSEGRFRWESPNFWKVGNFNENGQHVAVLPDIDEKVQLTSYTVSNSDDPMRSEIIISSHDPYADYSATVTHRHVPPSAKHLRGLLKPAMWVNDFFQDPDEQRLMAELISLHIAFQERIGQVDCVASPHIEINDQVRIYERQTEEVYVHYVRGINFSHDLQSGDYRMSLTTHWLAAGRDSGDVIGAETGVGGTATFGASSLLQSRIASGQYGKVQKDPGARL